MRKVQFQTDIDIIEAYLQNISLPKPTNKQTLSSDGFVSEDEVFKTLKLMGNNKSPGNNGLSKQFYECSWDEVKKPFLASIHEAFLNQESRTSQKQDVIKMLEKKGKDKKFITNWRSISLLNTDMKIISKVLSTRIESVLLFLISSNQ